MDLGPDKKFKKKKADARQINNKVVGVPTYQYKKRAEEYNAN